jgi:hypothetical protein
LHSHDDNKDKNNTISKRNKIVHSLTDSSSLARNSILLFPSALGIEYMYIVIVINYGRKYWFLLVRIQCCRNYLRLFSWIYSCRIYIFLVILGRYREDQSFNLCCHDNQQFRLGFKSNFLTTLIILKGAGIAYHFYFIIKIRTNC